MPPLRLLKKRRGTVSNRIKELRESLGISRKELSERSGVHYTKITDYENGYAKTENITVGNIFKIAAALGVTIDELVSDT